MKMKQDHLPKAGTELRFYHIATKTTMRLQFWLSPHTQTPHPVFIFPVRNCSIFFKMFYFF